MTVRRRLRNFSLAALAAGAFGGWMWLMLEAWGLFGRWMGWAP